MKPFPDLWMPLLFVLLTFVLVHGLLRGGVRTGPYRRHPPPFQGVRLLVLVVTVPWAGATLVALLLQSMATPAPAPVPQAASLSGIRYCWGAPEDTLPGLFLPCSTQQKGHPWPL